jgi:hypothetical protein
VSYTPSSPGDYTLSAAYGGDPAHQPSSGTVSLTATGTGTGTAPVETTPPTVTGTPAPGKTLTCELGQWLGSPRFAYQWDRDGVALYRNTSQSRRVVDLDEGSTLSCTVAATNPSGTTVADSPTVKVPIPHVAHCPGATGSLTRTRLGLIHLGMTRAAARHAYRQHTDRGKQYEDFFCLTPIGVRTGYASPKLRRTLSRSLRSRYTGRVVWASTSNPYYALDGVRVGEAADTAAAVLHTGRPLHIGRNYWYLAAKRKLTLVLKVRDATVQEIGIAASALTRTRAQQSTLMHSFY